MIDGLNIVGIDQLLDKAVEDANILLIEDDNDQDIFHGQLASHIKEIYRENKEAKENSGIEEDLMRSLRAYNGEYDPEDLARIGSEGGSAIYMNLTATKCRAASSWIKDILLGKEVPFSIEPTTLPELPLDIVEKIDTAIKQQYQEVVEQNGQQDIKQAQKTIKELNQRARDIKEAIYEEITSEAKWQMKKHELHIIDQMEEGEWTKALDQFIEDFTVFEVAIMKGPVITKKKKLSWEGGEVKVDEDYIFLNKRVSPFDIYPSASATDICDGNLVEHMRFSASELSSLKGTPGYNTEAIIQVLDEYKYGYYGEDLNDSLESEIAEEEKRGDSTKANKGVIHGLHFFGSVSADLLADWGMKDECIEFADPTDQFEVEAILVGSQVIKCKLNKDPLKRRPYYKASWQNRPGSWWGRSLPSLMRDIQRMCNATARALSNNMGLASGPQMEVYTDRLADDGDIENIRPFKIWQVTTDPTGAGGRAIQFNQPTSNAAELMAVYKEFELRADDATGIPRYAYGNERVGGAAQTASGLSMLLDSASKSIKDAIRHIDDGLIKPRVESQFYYNLLNNEDPSFTGDVNVVAKGSSSLTIKGAEQMRRNEFLQITANPVDLEIIGKEGRASILREIAKDLNLTTNIVPSRLELEDLEAKKAEQMQQQMALEEKKANKSLEATSIQVQGQMAMAQGAQRLKEIELALKQEKQDADVALKSQELAQDREKTIAKETSDLQRTKMTLDQKEISDKRDAAVKVAKG